MYGIIYIYILTIYMVYDGKYIYILVLIYNDYQKFMHFRNAL